MLFVRCRAGISHNPAEFVTVEDVDVALKVLERFILRLGAEYDFIYTLVDYGDIQCYDLM